MPRKFILTILLYINQRLSQFLNSCNILHKSQIGFLPLNRTADHVFILRINFDRQVYAHQHNEEIYACFVDFKRALDSVWHEGLQYKLQEIGIGSCFYKLIKSLYSTSSCAIKIGQTQTRPFRYSRGVRQGCVLSPLFFNLYINDLPFVFENIFYLILSFYRMAQN